MSAPYVSVVVPTIDRPDLVAKCIDGVLSGHLQEFEVVVVDQSEDDRTRRVVEERSCNDGRVRYVHSAVSGAARARNLGAERARGSVVAFIDDDAIPCERWLEAYRSAFQEIRPAPGMVAGRIRPMWERSRPRWLPTELLHVVGAYDAGEEVTEFPPGDFPMSGNFAVPRDVFQEVGGFDTGLGFDAGGRNPLLGGEDSHLGLKVLASGRRVYYHPGAEVRHLVPRGKAAPGYVLRRLYWSGRTYVQLRRRADGDRRRWSEVLRDARAKRQGRPRRYGAASGAGSRIVLASAMAAFALGAIAELAASAVKTNPAEGT